MLWVLSNLSRPHTQLPVVARLSLTMFHLAPERELATKVVGGALSCTTAHVPTDETDCEECAVIPAPNSGPPQFHSSISFRQC